MRFVPPLPHANTGEVIAIILHWVGNKVFHFECLRKAMFAHNPFGPLLPIFIPTAPPTQNMLRGILSDVVLDEFHQRIRKFKLDLDQRAALETMNQVECPMFHVRALAGTGKTVLALAILYSLVRSYKNCADSDKAVLLLLPSRELREDIILELKGSRLFDPSELMWFGRPASQCRLPQWEDHISCLLEELHRPTLARLRQLQGSLGIAVLHLRVWCQNRTAFYDIVDNAFPEDPRSQKYLLALAGVKKLVEQHTLLEVELLNNTPTHIRQLTKNIKIIVATAAWTKLQAGCSTGLASVAVKGKTIEVIIWDELQAYHTDQVLACAAQCQTAVFIGDEHQTIQNAVSSQWHRAPWTASSRKRTWQDMQDAEVDGADADGEIGRIGQVRNPTPRMWKEFLMKNTPCVVRCDLYTTKRFGQKVAKFLQGFLPDCCSRMESSSSAPNTELVHIFYKAPWESFGLLAENCAQRISQNRPANYCAVLFRELADEVLRDLRKANARKISPGGKPVVLVLCYLSRLSLPLQHFLESLLVHPDIVHEILPFTQKDVKVMLVDSARGITGHYCHVVRGRRWVDTPDQYVGIQGDPAREYIAYTRGRQQTTVWLEQEPFGWPGHPAQLQAVANTWPVDATVSFESSIWITEALMKAIHRCNGTVPYSVPSSPCLRNVGSSTACRTLTAWGTSWKPCLHCVTPAARTTRTCCTDHWNLHAKLQVASSGVVRGQCIYMIHTCNTERISRRPFVSE
jgi:hypothetical protein